MDKEAALKVINELLDPDIAELLIAMCGDNLWNPNSTVQINRRDLYWLQIIRILRGGKNLTILREGNLWKVLT